MMRIYYPYKSKYICMNIKIKIEVNLGPSNIENRLKMYSLLNLRYLQSSSLNETCKSKVSIKEKYS